LLPAALLLLRRDGRSSHSAIWLFPLRQPSISARRPPPALVCPLDFCAHPPTPLPAARTILFNAGCQVIIFLYLLDSETSMVVLLSAGMGTLIEFWKVTKAMDVKVVRLDNGLPWLSIKDRGSYTQSKTDQYDAGARPAAKGVGGAGGGCRAERS
jgi:hypothetical protein